MLSSSTIYDHFCPIRIKTPSQLVPHLKQLEMIFFLHPRVAQTSDTLKSRVENLIRISTAVSFINLRDCLIFCSFYPNPAWLAAKYISPTQSKKNVKDCNMIWKGKEKPVRGQYWKDIKWIGGWYKLFPGGLQTNKSISYILPDISTISIEQQN